MEKLNWIIIIVVIFAVAVGIFALLTGDAGNGNSLSYTPGTTGQSAIGQVVKQETTKEQVQPQIEQKITLFSYTSIIKEGEPVSFSWKVDGSPQIIKHTAIHYGQSSVANPTSPSSYPGASDSLCSNGCNIPNTFSVNLAFPDAGVYYFRAHAVLGKDNVWSDEYKITVTKEPEAKLAIMPTSSSSGGYSYGGY